MAALAAVDVDRRAQAVMGRAACRQEADDARRRAIAQSLSRAFNEPDSTELTANANVLGKGHRLSKHNPLMNDPFEFS